MTDVVNAYLGQAAQLVKVGGSLTMGLIDDLIPDVVTVRWLDGADEGAIHRAAGDPAAVLALDLSPEGELGDALIAMLANRPSGARTVLLSALPAVALPAKELADQLSRSGHRCVHVVPLDPDSGTTLRCVIGIQAVSDGLLALQDNQKVLDAAVTAAQPVPASLNDVDALKAAVVTVSERAAVDHVLMVGIESWPIAWHLLRSSPEATIGFDVPASALGGKVQP